MNSDISEIQDAWEKRHEQLGHSKRSVLFKNLPDYFNNRIHRLHIKSIKNALNDDTKTILDVGCGYGRIAKDLLEYKPALDIEGVELSTSSARHFEEHVGSCFHGSLQDFIPKKTYDAIIIVTVLMYVNKDELSINLEKLWQALRPGGVLVCIEPIENVFISLRKKYKLGYFEPTAKNTVNYFNNKSFNQLSKLPNATVTAEETIGLLPLFNTPVLHKAITITKQK